MSTYGITSKATSQITSAIDAYVKSLIDMNQIAIDKTKLNNAFKGSRTQSQILRMASAVDDRVKDLARNLYDLKNDINNLNNKYKKNDADDGSNVFDKTIKNLGNYNVKWNNSSQPGLSSVTSNISKKS